MPAIQLFAVEWPDPTELLRVLEPRRQEVVAASGALATYYNDAHNSAMMAHEAKMSISDVMEHFDELWGDGDRPFLLEQDGALIGDADLRQVDGGTAEFAIMIGARAAQGRGLGTRFAIMVNLFAFDVLALQQLYVSIIPANHASQRLFGKLGYEVDNGAAARAYADEPDDVTMSLGRDRFRSLYGAILDQIRVVTRT